MKSLKPLLFLSALMMLVIVKAQTTTTTPTNTQYIAERNAKYAAMFKQQQSAGTPAANGKDSMSAADKKLIGPLGTGDKKEPNKVVMIKPEFH